MQTDYRRIILVVLAGFFVTAGVNESIAKQPLFEAYRRVIAIDPGHGGDEPGAEGPNGTTEKGVTLSLARTLATELQRKYRVVLTRSEDNRVDLEMRTALANHNKADLLISLHAGGSFVHSTSGLLIYHYQDFAEDPRKRADPPPTQGQTENPPILWDQVQGRHLAKSRVLARLLDVHLNDSALDQESRVRGAPLLLLQGANMPAVLIEIGYLSNPAEEKQLQDQRFLIDLALKISRGVDEYFEQEQ